MYRMSWTDERMDDFAAHTYRSFDEVNRRLDGIERRMDDGFKRVDERFEAMHRLMLQSSIAIVVALIGLIATQL
jgi:hypothetical protein